MSDPENELYGPTHQHIKNEWTFCEDEDGVVYCLGRNVEHDIFEAVAVYEYTPSGEGSKRKIDSDRTYNRIMYHGFPEEDERLNSLQPHIKRSILAKLSRLDHCIYINPKGLEPADEEYSKIDFWRGNNTTVSREFRTALERAITEVEILGIDLDEAMLYGGAAYGLMGKASKRVDDIDFLLRMTSADVLAAVKEALQPYRWKDIDPSSILSTRRMLLKAKRWSTSQIRSNNPDFMSIDLKTSRSNPADTLWNRYRGENETDRFEGDLKVVSDNETFCISPALQCEDKDGNEIIILMRGYPYIGTSVNGDVISVSGTLERSSRVVTITQAKDDALVPDMTNVPIT